MNIPFQVKNFRTDMSDGLVLAHILKNYDENFDLNQIFNLNSVEDRLHNWRLI